MLIKTTSHFEDIGFHIRQEISKAKESIKICVAWISWIDYNGILEELSRKGVSVEILYNDDHLNRKHFIKPDESINLFPVKGRFYHSLMHNKFCIIDNRIIVTGSFNWSRRAFYHFENIVFIENDFKLVKNFLHEFEDLKNYFYGFNNHEKIQCGTKDSTQCKSQSYNLGIFGNESGLYDESLVDIWNICLSNGHVSFLGEEYENHLHSYLGLTEQPDWDGVDGFYDRESMLNEFRQERAQIQMIQNYFNTHQGTKIHAIGAVVMENSNEHLKWGEDPNYAINILWRDMYYRKLIPDTLYDGFYDISSIINRHAPI